MVDRVSTEAITAALSFIPADDRDTWLRVGMGLKSELGENGFPLFESWSERGVSFDSNAVKSTWKSIKPGGAVTIATLIGEAKKHGFDPKRFAPPAPLSEAEKVRLQREKAERAAAAAATEAEQHASAAVEAMRLWGLAEETGVSAYLERKKVAGNGVRYQKKMLLVPLVDETGKLWNVQRILDNGDKRVLKGGRVTGCFHLIGTIQDGGWLLFAEGYATVATLHQASGHPVVMCVNRTNIRHVAKLFRQMHPSVKQLICADDDRETETRTGNNPGVTAAAATAKALAAHWCKPASLPEGSTDFNDMAAHAGAAAVSAQIAAVIAEADAAAARPTQKKAKVAADIDPQSTRPFFRVSTLR